MRRVLRHERNTLLPQEEYRRLQRHAGEPLSPRTPTPGTRLLPPSLRFLWDGDSSKLDGWELGGSSVSAF